jgi:hypothetical protein
MPEIQRAPAYAAKDPTPGQSETFHAAYNVTHNSKHVREQQVGQGAESFAPLCRAERE